MTLAYLLHMQVVVTVTLLRCYYRTVWVAMLCLEMWDRKHDILLLFAVDVCKLLRTWVLTFVVLTSMSIKVKVLLDMTPCSFWWIGTEISKEPNCRLIVLWGLEV